jgi:hypothetical protein
VTTLLLVTTEDEQLDHLSREGGQEHTPLSTPSSSWAGTREQPARPPSTSSSIGAAKSDEIAEWGHGARHRACSAGPTNFARSTQPSPRGRAAQLELPRSRSAATLNVRSTQPSPRGRAPQLELPRTPRAAASLGPRLARHLARHSAGPRAPLGILVGAALAAAERILRPGARGRRHARGLRALGGRRRSS